MDESMSKINTDFKMAILSFFFSKEIAKYISRALQEKRLLYFGMANLDFKFSDPVYASFLFLEFLKLAKKGLSLTHSLSSSGSVDTRGRCARSSARNLEVRQGNRKITKKGNGE